MTEPKFTPGPWYAAQPEECGGWWIVATDPEGCDCIDSGDGGFEKADAHLIAAAPELYEALVDMHRTQLNNNKHDPDDYENTEQFLRVTATLAKARGESHD